MVGLPPLLFNFMEILRMLKRLTLLILLVPVVAYSQTTEVTNDVKNHCKSFNDTAFWSEEESVCSVTFKGEKTVMHYVGGWSEEGANGYGQFYEYDADDGTLMSIYKGQFKKSVHRCTTSHKKYGTVQHNNTDG